MITLFTLKTYPIFVKIRFCLKKIDNDNVFKFLMCLCKKMYVTRDDYFQYSNLNNILKFPDDRSIFTKVRIQIDRHIGKHCTTKF